jgi:hypothetical protein
MAVVELAFETIGVAVVVRTGCPFEEVGWWGRATPATQQDEDVCGSVRRGEKRDDNNTHAERRSGKPD